MKLTRTQLVNQLLNINIALNLELDAVDNKSIDIESDIFVGLKEEQTKLKALIKDSSASKSDKEKAFSRLGEISKIMNNDKSYMLNTDEQKDALIDLIDNLQSYMEDYYGFSFEE